MSLFVQRLRAHRCRLALVALVWSATGCGRTDKPADTTAAATAMTPPAPVADSMTGTSGASGMRNMQGMAVMTGDADHDFLRMMSDHHKGLILMAHMTKERKENGPSASDARKLDAEQDGELDRMTTMLEKDYKDAYAPKVMPEHQKMADELKSKSGTAYDKAFYENIIKHHEEAIKMVDDYLPRAKSAAVKPMAEKMKATQGREIEQMKATLAKIGA